MSNTVIMPAFTFKTMLTPEAGPEQNAMSYGSGRDLNRMAEFFTPDMPPDPLMGPLMGSDPRGFDAPPHGKALLASDPLFCGDRC